MAESIARARERIRAARDVLPDAPSFYDVVRHTNPKAPVKRNKRAKRLFSTHDLRNYILYVLHRCQKESDFAVLQVTLRESLAEVTSAKETAMAVLAATGLPAYMTTAEVAKFLDQKVATVHSWRMARNSKQRGPSYATHGIMVRYRTEDVLEWARRHVRVGKTWHPIEGVEHPDRKVEALGADEMTTAQAAKYLNIPLKTLLVWRKRGIGPTPVRVRKKFFLYTREDLDHFRDQSMFESG